MQLLAALVVGILLGVAGGRFLFVGSWLSLVPWSLAALAMGYRAGRRRWLSVGGVYGFGLLFAFMVAGYTGAASLMSRVPFFAIIAVAGAVYGCVLAWLGARLRPSLRSTDMAGGAVRAERSPKSLPTA
jgi:hypothetical protein